MSRSDHTEAGLSLAREVAHSLEELRLAERIGKTELADSIGMDVQTLNRYITSSRIGSFVTLEMVARISRSLGYETHVTFVRVSDPLPGDSLRSRTPSPPRTESELAPD